MSLRLIAAAVLLTGCGTVVVTEEVRAVRDFVAVSDLERADNIRHYYRQLHYTYVNDYFLAVAVGSRHYLVEFGSSCQALRNKNFVPSMVDHVKTPSYLNKGDTIRGCPVKSIYTATADQLEEIKALSEAHATGMVVPAQG